MTALQPIQFDPQICARELDEFARLLVAYPSLSEREQILPFFRARPHLTAFLGSYHPDLVAYDRLAYELRLFGSFTADVVIGDWENHSFCFVEFEDAGLTSIFQRGRRDTSTWARPFLQGFGQVVDWFWKLADLEGTVAFAQLFGAATIKATALVVVGRSSGVGDTDHARLEWWRTRVVVNSSHIYCCTFDELVQGLQRRLQYYPDIRLRK